MPQIVHVLHDNPEWLPPFRAAFEDAGLELREWLLDETATIDLAEEPPPGVYWSRLSASAHTRGRPRAKEIGRGLLAWLELSGRTVVNGRRALELEVSKSAQHAALHAAGIDVPRSIAVLDRDHLVAAAERIGGPLILKHNQGGKGLGVRAYETPGKAGDADLDDSVDGITLVQERLIPVEPFVTRAEFVGGRFVYAVRVDTSAGGFELCPAEACEVGAGSSHEPFELRAEITAEHPLILRLAALLPVLGIDVAGVEFIETTDGRTVVYDINTNTNYNPAVEAASVASGPRAIAQYLKEKTAVHPGDECSGAEGVPAVGRYSSRAAEPSA